MSSQEENNKRKFVCDTCDFQCSYESDFKRHSNSKKHNKRANQTLQDPKTFTCECGKQYKHASTLSKHRKSCKGRQEDRSVIPQEDPITKLQGEIRELREQILQHQQFMEKQSENLNKLLMEFLSKVQFHPGREAPL
jgi:ribosomal protein L32